MWYSHYSHIKGGLRTEAVVQTGASETEMEIYGSLYGCFFLFKFVHHAHIPCSKKQIENITKSRDPYLYFSFSEVGCDTGTLASQSPLQMTLSDALSTPGTWGLSPMAPACGLQSSQFTSSEQEGGRGSSHLHNSVSLLYSENNITSFF